MSADEYKNKGNDSFAKKDYAIALDYYTHAIAVDQNSSTLYSNRAAAHLMLEHWKEALEDSNRAISIDPEFSKAYLRKGKALTKFGRYDEAVRVFKEGCRLCPSSAFTTEIRLVETLINEISLARKYVSAEKFNAAVTSYDEVIKHSPLLDKAKVELGFVLISMKNFRRAANISNELLRSDSSNLEALNLRGAALYYTAANGNFASSQSIFRSILQLDPDNEQARIMLKKIRTLESKKKEGNDAFGAGKYEEAIAAYTEALNMDHLNDELNKTLFSNRAAALKQISKYKEALADCNAALEIDENYTRCLTRRAEIYSLLEMFEDSVRDWERLHSMDPSEETSQKLQEAKLELKKSKRKDYYKILGVSKHAGDTEIKKAYYKMAKKWHPDKQTDESTKHEAEVKFKEIGEAYAVLSDPQKRQRYDSGVDPDEMGGMRTDIDPSQIFSMFFGGMGGMGGAGGRGRHNGFPGGGGVRFHFG